MVGNMSRFQGVYNGIGGKGAGRGGVVRSLRRPRHLLCSAGGYPSMKQRRCGYGLFESSGVGMNTGAGISPALTVGEFIT